MNSPTPPRDDDVDDDIDAWIKELARRDSADPEARALGDAVRHHTAQRHEALLQHALTSEAQEQALQRLRFRLRQEGLVASRSGGAAVLQRPLARWSAAAAALAALTVGVALWQQRPIDDGIPLVADQPPAWRGAIAVQARTAKNPQATARQLAKAIAPFDTRPVVYVHDQQVTLDFDVPPGQTSQVASAIQPILADVTITAGTNRISLTEP